MPKNEASRTKICFQMPHYSARFATAMTNNAKQLCSTTHPQMKRFWASQCVIAQC
jgi:hypothetical protein